MNMGTKVFLAILFVLFFMLLLFEYYRLSNIHVIVRNPPLVFAPAGLPLDPSVLASLPVLDYVAGSMALECAVCISEFKAGEKIRLLPSCNHCFHIECVDMWFQSHATCPLCRASIENFDQELGVI